MSSTSIFSEPASVIFLVIGIVGLGVGIPALVVGLFVWVSTRRASKGHATDSTSIAAVRRARIGRIGGLITGVVMGFVSYFATNGILTLTFVGIGYLLGVLVIELRPTNLPTGPIRAASLQARSAWQYVPKWVVYSTFVVTLLSLVSPVVFAVIPPPAGNTGGQLVAAMLPVAAVAAVALIAWLTLMHRVARLPQPVTDESEPSRISATRANAARAISGAVFAIGLMTLAGVLALSVTFLDTYSQGPGYEFGRVVVVFAQGLSVVGLIAWAALSRWRSAPAKPADPADPASAEPSTA